ncbi:putative siderophore transport system permease protein YfiZ precursor [Corynebacterium felinum]|nr:iron ABC transporter permease [Corynebacterium felinum]WJY96010.1 putative siderophore transport system permease protein YfiZ precursor [Corynebacterium felinum]
MDADRAPQWDELIYFMRLFRLRAASLIVTVGLLALCMAASLMFGSNNIPLAEVLATLQGEGAHESHVVVIDQRLPRTVVVMVVGASLGVAGALMQGLTRNPLADPGILGINAGSALAVVAAVAFFGQFGIASYVWWAIAGAVVASVAVYALGGAGRRGVTPARLTLAGVALSMAISALVQAILLSNQNAFNEFRYWASGSVEGRGWSVLATVGLFMVVGLVLAFLATPALNALALGDDTGKALGVRVGTTRVMVVVAVTLLCGAATAAVGPIMFVGLAVPYVARMLVGTDQRLVIPACVVVAPIFLLSADIAARLVVMPMEIQTGIMSALIGGPVFIAIVRRKNLETFA